MPHLFDGLLPNDAPWRTLPVVVVIKQCALRNNSVAGLKKDLVQRLSAYRTPFIKRLHPWLTEPVNRASYEEAEREAEHARLQIERVVDKNPHRRWGSFTWGSLRRDFEICDKRLWQNHAWDKGKPVTVSIGTVLQCDCSLVLYGPCVHILYVLRFVLNCPEPYRWQRALLPSELQTIYKHSHASRALGPLTSETHNSFCIFCFQDIDKTNNLLKKCEKCTIVMHHVCIQNAGRLRMPMKEGTCWICYEDIKWNIEKFCWNNRGLPAAPRIIPAIPARTGSAAEATRELIQHKEPEDDVFKTVSSSSNKDSKERQLSNTQSTHRRFPSVLSALPPSSSTSPALKSTVNQVVPYPVDRLRQGDQKSKIVTLELVKEGGALSTSSPNNESTPVPGNPALDLQETQNTREKQQQDKEGQQAALPNLSPQLGHALPTSNFGGGDMEPSEVTPAPNAARIPAGDPTSPHASSSAAETSACTATTATPQVQHDQAGATSIPARDISVEGGMSQPSQVSVTTATTTEPAGATGAQRTISEINTDNSASASASVPTDRSTSAPTHAHSGMQTTIDHVKAMELVQECSRLVKSSTQIRKKSERETKRMEKKHRREMKKITKMEKKHRRELKKTKRKSNQEVKRLEKKVENLEKKLLKAFAGQGVVDEVAA